MKSYILCFTLILNSYCYAQTKRLNQQASIEKFITAYNTQDYKSMKKTLGFIGRIIISKKSLKNEYQAYYKKYGTLSIDTIIYNSKYNGNVELKSKIHPSKRIFMSFVFSESAKLEGFGFGYPTFVYKKKPDETSEVNKARIQELIDSTITRRFSASPPYNFNGSVLVSKNDTILYKKSKGYSNFEILKPINDTTLFLLASCSKQFTALAIMMLQEEGKLNILDNVNNYIPNFPYSNITIENLLTHTSGLPDYLPLIKKYGNKNDFITNSNILTLLIEHYQKLKFTPNSQFDYSNTGYVILSLIIESSSGQSYEHYLTSKIFEPLNMNNTAVYNRRKEKNTLSNYALGYVFSNESKKYVLPDSLSVTNYVSYMDGITGDDGISSCILDVKKWTEAIKSNKLINSQSTHLITSTHKLTNGKETNYGFGFITRKGTEIEDIIYHTGSWPGYTSMIIELLERNETIIILCNTDYNGLTFLADEIIFNLVNHNYPK